MNETEETHTHPTFGGKFQQMNKFQPHENGSATLYESIFAVLIGPAATFD